jgi:hypothetical protein
LHLCGIGSIDFPSCLDEAMYTVKRKWTSASKTSSGYGGSSLYITEKRGEGELPRRDDPRPTVENVLCSHPEKFHPVLKVAAATRPVKARAPLQRGELAPPNKHFYDGAQVPFHQDEQS